MSEEAEPDVTIEQSAELLKSSYEHTRPLRGRMGQTNTTTPLDDSRRCVAHKKTGERCRLASIPGGRVCKKHGGAAPHVKAAAQARLEMATDKAAQDLIDMAHDYGLDWKRPDVRLAALKDVLDRGGIGKDSTINVNVDAKPFERILSGIAALSREESRELRKQQEQGNREEPIDVEVVDSETVRSDEPDGTEEVSRVSGFERLTHKQDRARDD